MPSCEPKDIAKVPMNPNPVIRSYLKRLVILIILCLSWLILSTR